MLNLASPPMSVMVAKIKEPFLNVTVPGGVPQLDDTVAVKLTISLKIDGLREDASAVEVGACATVSWTKSLAFEYAVLLGVKVVDKMWGPRLSTVPEPGE